MPYLYLQYTANVYINNIYIFKYLTRGKAKYDFTVAVVFKMEISVF